jgi:hypothetical protein
MAQNLVKDAFWELYSDLENSIFSSRNLEFFLKKGQKFVQVCLGTS